MQNNFYVGLSAQKALLRRLDSIANNDLVAFDQALFGHVNFVATRAVRALACALTSSSRRRRTIERCSSSSACAARASSSSARISASSLGSPWKNCSRTQNTHPAVRRTHKSCRRYVILVKPRTNGVSHEQI